MRIEPHLNLVELVLLPAGEWKPGGVGWIAVRAAEGFGYCLYAGAAVEFKTGDALIIGPNSDTTLRASQLVEVRLEYFRVAPERLNGLITVTEWRRLGQIPAAPHVFHYAAKHILAQKFTRLSGLSGRTGLGVRSALLELWASCVTGLLAPSEESVPPKRKLEATFRQFIGQISETDLAASSLAELAAQLNCSERHLSRLFRTEFGMSLREKQTEFSLQRACQLLLEPRAKIRSVAYDTGYRHVGFFNALFKKRFGLSPKEWRQQNLPATPNSPGTPLESPPAPGDHNCVVE